MSVEIYSPDAVHPPHDFEVGRVQDVLDIDAEAYRLEGDLVPAKLVQTQISDPNINYLHATKPGRVQEIQHQEQWMDRVSASRFARWLRKDKAVVAYDQEVLKSINTEESTAFGDKVSRDKFFGVGGILGDPALRLWRKLIPQATALTPLANPYNVENVYDPKTGQTEPMTDMTREWMTACTDGWEIRNRTAIMVDEIGGHIGKYAATHADTKMVVVSIAGGTALATMQSIMRSGVDPSNVELVLLESNPHSLQMATALAGRIGYKGVITKKEVDVFDPKAMKAVKQELDDRQAKVIAVDAVGIAEYSTEQLRTAALERRYGADYMLYNPDKFIAACLDFASEDGLAVIGQMNTNRPNPHFTRGVVSWPYICMRSVNNFASLLKDGGADLGLSKLSLTPLGAYTMASIYKTPQMAAQAGLINSVERSPFVRSWQTRTRCVGSLAASGEIA